MIYFYIFDFEGFAPLPRHREEERPASIKPEPAEVADVRNLNLSSRTFRARVAGLWLLVILMKDSVLLT